MDNFTIEFDGKNKKNIGNLYELLESYTKRPCFGVGPTLFPDHIDQWLESRPLEGISFGTITLGYKKWLELSHEDIYKKLRNVIKYNFRNYEYFVVTEFTKSNIMHMHMLIYDCYPAVFHKCMKQFGSRNIHESSFKKIKNRKIAEYLFKDQYDKLLVYDDYTEIKKGNRHYYPMIINKIETPEGNYKYDLIDVDCKMPQPDDIQ